MPLPSTMCGRARAAAPLPDLSCPHAYPPSPLAWNAVAAVLRPYHHDPQAFLETRTQQLQQFCNALVGLVFNQSANRSSSNNGNGPTSSPSAAQNSTGRSVSAGGALNGIVEPAKVPPRHSPQHALGVCLLGFLAPVGPRHLLRSDPSHQDYGGADSGWPRSQRQWRERGKPSPRQNAEMSAGDLMNLAVSLYKQHHTAQAEAAVAVQRPVRAAASRGGASGDGAVRVFVPASVRTLDVDIERDYFGCAAVVARHRPVDAQAEPSGGGRQQQASFRARAGSPTGGGFLKNADIHVGDVLVRVDNEDVSKAPHEDVVDMLRARAGEDRVLFFLPEREHYSIVRGGDGGRG